MKIAKRIFMYILIGVLSIPIFVIAYFYITWKSIIIDENLPKQAIYKTFDHQKQESIFGGESDKNKTNNFRIKIDSLEGQYFSCSVYNYRPFLKIYLSIGDGFSGGGYDIDIVNNRYKLSPYYYTDVIKPFDFFESEEYYKILNKKLILNKDSYKKGDSIFGYIELKIQKRYGPEKYFEEGKGYFKAVVE
ncbi:hypothetical protein [Chryseobacterium polytrichastri]|nr:hypothetical protein [Chryseobacterium polytrichastri]